MIKSHIFRLAVFLSVATIASAQFTTLTGTVIDPNNLPYGNGTISAALVIPGGQSPTLNGYIYSPPTQPVGLNLAGAFLMRLADNTVLQPGGTQWTFTVCSAIGGIQPSSGKGPVCFSVTLTISGAAQDISAQLQAAALPLSNIASGGGGTPGGTNTQLQFNNSGAFGGLPNASSGSALVSQGLTTRPAFQQKPVYDVRDFGLACNGSTNDTAALASLTGLIGTTPATIAFPIDSTHPGPCELGSITVPSNVDFSGGGSIGLVNNPATPGNGVLVQANGAGFTGTSCSVTLPSNPTAGNAILFEIQYEYAGGGHPTTPTDSSNDAFTQLQQSNLNYQSNATAWGAAYVAGGAGSKTISVTLTGSSPAGSCFAQEVSGLGTGLKLDASSFAYATGSSPYSGPYSSGAATLQSGDFVIAYGGQGTNTGITCSSPSLTQPAGNAGNVNGSCFQYQNVSSAGSLTATQAISGTTTDYWVYNVLGIRPGPSTVRFLAKVNDPDEHQIFYNATGGTAGSIDFTGNLTNFDIYPEWWGAGSTASATTNTAALQGAIYGAFGIKRTNSSALSLYNKPLYLDQNFQINGELKLYDVLNFKVKCDRRLSGGITQTASNLRIIDGQAIAYGSFDDCYWSGNASSSTWLIGLDYNSTILGYSDLAPQFIDFNRNTFNGNGVVSSGVAIAPSGGAAQGSNIYCWNCEGESFTFAVWQIGTTTNGATNAIDDGWYGGDMEGNPQYGLYSNAGGSIFVRDTTMENASQGLGTQTGFDMYCQNNIGQEPCIMENVRSESRRLISAGIGIVRNSYIGNGGAYPTPGTSLPVGTIIIGSNVGWDGGYYKVTVDSSAFSGAGTPSALLTASGGSSTTLTDTNQTIAGSVTIGTVGVTTTETMTQSVSGATATRLNSPASTGTISGGLTSGSTFVFGDSAQQAGTGVTCTVQSGNSSTAFTCNNFSGTPNGSGVWTDTTISSTFTPSGTPVFSATTMLITAATGTPDNHDDWVGGTSGIHFTPTATPANEVNWTANAFNGMRVSTMAGTGVGCYGVITSNTAQTVTFSAGFVGVYNGLACTTPDTTTKYLVEPGWNGGTVVSGGITMVALNENGIDGSNGNGGMHGILENVYMPGEQVNIAPTAYVKNLQVTRPDWLPAAGGGWWGAEVDHDWDVHLTQFVTYNTNTYYRNWKFSGPTLPTLFNGPQQRNLGTVPLIWSCGYGGGLSNVCNDVWIGGRSDPFATNTASRNVLEFGGYLGRATPTGVNQNGTDTDIQGGLPTGSGTPGNINLRCAPGGGSSGSAVQTSNICAKVTPSGVQTASGTPYTTTPWASTAVALDTNAISNTPGSNCDTTTVTATGVVSGDVIECGAQGSLTGITGYVPSTTGTLTIFPPWAGTNQVFIQVCNQTSTASITPGAVTLSCHDTK